MKPFLAIMALFTVLAAYSQMTPGNDSMEAQIQQRRASRPDQTLLNLSPEKPNEIRQGNVVYSGIFVQLAKTDNPFQLINPAAPPEYGSGKDNVVSDRNTGREGLKLFSIRF